MAVAAVKFVADEDALSGTATITLDEFHAFRKEQTGLAVKSVLAWLGSGGQDG